MGVSPMFVTMGRQKEISMTLMEVESRLVSLEAEIAALKEQLERVEASAAHRRGIEQIERGEGVPAVEAVRALGRKYGLERS
jgi:hypothetical protein